MKCFSVLALGFGFAIAGAPVASSGYFGLIFAERSPRRIFPSTTSQRVFEGGSLSIPHIEISGSSLSKTDLQALVDGPWGLSTAETLSKFDAASVTIPEIRLEFTAPLTGNGAAEEREPCLSRRAHRGDQGRQGGARQHGGHVRSKRWMVHVTMQYLHRKASRHRLRFRRVWCGLIYAAAQPGEAPKQISGPSTFG